MFRTKPGEGRALIEDRINRPSLRKLVEAFGGTWPDGDLEHMVAQLVEFSEVWDYRGGKNSRLMFHDKSTASDPYEDLTFAAADELGQTNPVPPSECTYDYLLILGGLATGVEPRVKYASQLLRQGLMVGVEVAGLGSFRELHDRELPIARRYAPDGRYEIDHLVSMMSLEIVGNPYTPGHRMSDQPEDSLVLPISLAGERGPVVVAYSAIGPDPGQRSANTAETYELFLESTRPRSGQSALLVTSSIYALYQHLDAVRVFTGWGIEIETVGTASTGRQSHRASAYRQEIRSTLLSAARLLSGPALVQNS